MNFWHAARDLLAIAPYHRALSALSSDVEWERSTYGNHARQYALVAKQRDPLAPVAVYFHGGGWQFGSPELLQAFGAYFYARGFTVWLPSHRRLPRFGGSRIVADAFAALHHIQAAQPLPPHLLLGGMSSGGHLAALCALRQNEWLERGSVQGLLLCGAPLSLHHLGHSPTRIRFAGRRSNSAFAKLDPMTHLSTSAVDIPTVVIHGTHDGLVPYACSQAFVEEAKSRGWTDIRLVTLPAGTHLDAACWIWP